MKEIIEAIIAASMGSDIIDKAKKEFHKRFINGELNKELLEDCYVTRTIKCFNKTRFK